MEKTGNKKKEIDLDEVFKDLKADYDRGQNERRRIADIIARENKVLSGELQGNEKKGKSKFVKKEAAKIINRTMPGLTEPFLSTERPIKVSKAGSPLRKSLFENYLNMQFVDTMDREELVEEMAKVYLTSPKLWIQPDWIFEEEEEVITFNDGTKQVTSYITENRPDLKIIQPQNVTIDPDATREEDSTFICVNEISSLSKILQEGGEGKASLFNKEQIRKLKDWIKEGNQTNTTTSEFTGVFDPARTQENTSASDKSRKSLEIVRYYGYYDIDDCGIAESIYAVWVLDADIWLTIEKREFPLKRIPIYGTQFDKIPFSLNGNSMIHFLEDNQKIQTGIMRGILDNLDEANNGTIFYRPGDITPETLLQMRLGHKYIAMNNPKGIEKGNFNQIPNSVFSISAMLDRENQELAGNTPATPSVNNQQMDKENSQAVLSLSQEKQISSIRKIGGVLRKAMKHILIEAEMFLDDEQIMEYLPPNFDPSIFSETRRVKIGTQVGTIQSRMQEAHNVNMLMQHSKTNEKVMPEVIHKQLLAKSFELFGEYGMANMIRGSQPESNPVEQYQMELAMQKLQLENRKLIEEINEIRIRAATSSVRQNIEAQESASRVQKNIADANSKEAGAQKQRVESSFIPAEKLQGLEGKQNSEIGKEQ